jgi:hypothetical protein
MKMSIRIGVDLAKNFFQVHGIEREDGPALTRNLSRAKFRECLARSAPCRVGMEACGSSYYWGRELRAMRHDVVMMPPAYTEPYVKRGKNDAADAAAHLRGDVAARHALRADQEQGSANRADAAQDPGFAGQAANDERQRGARPSPGVWPDRGARAFIASRTCSPSRSRTPVFPMKRGEDRRVGEEDRQASAKYPVSRPLDEIPAIGPLGTS